MRKSTKPIPEADRSKPKKRREMPQSTGNKRLAEQIRKILGKHYANKYWDRATRGLIVSLSGQSAN
jgi:hypothetical protein